MENVEKILIDNIEQACWKFGWTVIIKDFYNILLKTPGIFEIMHRFLNHLNPYCSLIKSDAVAYEHCVEVSNRHLLNKIMTLQNPKKGFFGTCFAGINEFVMPVYCDGNIVGAVLVNACQCEKERQETTKKRLVEEFHFQREELDKQYALISERKQEDLSYMISCAKLWADYLENICQEKVDREVLARLVKAYKNGGEVREDKLHLAVSYIKKHLTEHLSITEIANACHYSESTLAHAFKNELRTTVNDFIVKERLELAKSMLNHTCLSIGEIAEKSGFRTNKYLSYVFKEKLNITPKEYRNKKKGKRI